MPHKLHILKDNVNLFKRRLKDFLILKYLTSSISGPVTAYICVRARARACVCVCVYVCTILFWFTSVTNNLNVEACEFQHADI
jgi:hypothetical protein